MTPSKPSAAIARCRRSSRLAYSRAGISLMLRPGGVVTCSRDLPVLVGDLADVDVARSLEARRPVDADELELLGVGEVSHPVHLARRDVLRGPRRHLVLLVVGACPAAAAQHV